MNDDDAAAPRQEFVQVGPIRRVGDVTRTLRVQHEHVGGIELGLGRERFRTYRNRPPLVQQRHPFTQEARIIVRARSMRLRPGADEHPQRVLRNRGKRRRGADGNRDEE